MYVYFKSITLENVRSFGKKQTIDFADKDGNASMWNLILGDNGTGKTTVLKGVITSWEYFDAEAPMILNLGSSYFNRRKNLQSQINNEMYLLGGDGKIINTYMTYGDLDGLENEEVVSMRLNASVSPELREIKPSIFAYGAARRIGTSGITNEQQSTIVSLLDDNVPLLNTEEWLAQAEYLYLKDQSQANRFEQVKALLLRLFKGEISDIKIETNGSNGKKISVLFETHYGWVPLHQLSLGYKTLLAWMVDFARGLFERYPDSPDPLTEPAVCLVDEIDLHLHPHFQREMIGFLSGIFKKTQFIVTAHSPLVVQAAADAGANIILLERKGDEVVVNNDPLVVRRWRVDQILSSELFGELDPSGPSMERRRTLLRKPHRTSDDEQEIQLLEEDLHIIAPDAHGDTLDEEIEKYLRSHLVEPQI